ncbi:MAG: nitroreductase family protein [Armatimonadota bacterium]
MIKAIEERYSCRSYSSDPVSDEDVQEIVEAGMNAPSGVNHRPWHVVVVRDEETRKKLSQTHQYAGFCAESPVVFAVCGDETESEHWWREDCAALIENMLLQATDLGLGTCWIGILGSEQRGHDREEHVRKTLGIPDHIRVSALVSCGYPARPGKPKPPGPMDNVHHEEW